MEFDGVSVSSSGYNRAVDYDYEHEHEHEHEHGEEPEPSDADDGLTAHGSRVIDGSFKFKTSGIKKGSVHDADR
jgi:hypothetical protein